ncbi:MAG: NAD(P)-binding domain-containing protein [Trebonia sp.]
MRIGVVGAGRIGGNLARLLTMAGHEVVISQRGRRTTVLRRPEERRMTYGTQTPVQGDW